MQLSIDINLLAILLAAVAGILVGYLWYSPMLFGKLWIHLTGWDEVTQEEMKKGAVRAYGMSIIGACLYSFILANLASYTGASTFVSGVSLGFFAWIGFVFPMMATNAAFLRKPWKLVWIDVGHYLVSLMIAGGIVGAMT